MTRNVTVANLPSRDLPSNIALWLTLANGAEWADETTPKTERPVRFTWGRGLFSEFSFTTRVPLA